MEGEVSPTASPISRTDGRVAALALVASMQSRIWRWRTVMSSAMAWLPLGSGTGEQVFAPYGRVGAWQTPVRNGLDPNDCSWQPTNSCSANRRSHPVPQERRSRTAPGFLSHPLGRMSPWPQSFAPASAPPPPGPVRRPARRRPTPCWSRCPPAWVWHPLRRCPAGCWPRSPWSPCGLLALATPRRWPPAGRRPAPSRRSTGPPSWSKPATPCGPSPARPGPARRGRRYGRARWPSSTVRRPGRARPGP